VLVPLVRGQTARPLLSVGDALISRGAAGSGVVLGLVETGKLSSDAASTDLERVRDMLKWISGSDYEHPGRPSMEVEVRFSSDAPATIRAAVVEYSCSAVVLGYPWLAAPGRQRLRSICEALLNPAPADLLLVRPALAAPEAALAPRSILVAVRGGPHERLMASVVRAFAHVARSKVTLVHVSRPSDHRDRRRHSLEDLQKFADGLKGVDVSIKMEESPSPMTLVLELSSKHDMVLVGSHLDPEAPDRILSPALRQLMSRCTATVILGYSAAAQDWQAT